MHTVVDLFCGSGGFSLGARLADFEVVASVDKDETLTSAYSSNFPSSNLMLRDVTTLTAAEIALTMGKGSLDVDGVIGGPPCQGFSLIGRRDAADPRNELVPHFFRLVREIRPKFFVMENVPGIVAGKSLSALEECIQSLTGYKVLGPIFIDAHDLGAATKRKRVVVIGYDPARVDDISADDIDAMRVQKTHSVLDAISDLPEPNESGRARYREVPTVGDYAKRCRRPPPASLGSESCRMRVDSGTVTDIAPTAHTPSVVARFSLLSQGDIDPVSRFPRLSWTKPAPTLRAGTGPDRGSHQAARPIHPDQHRVITVREAARLQGFPDWFQFHGTKWHSFRMVGNSVSPIMAEALLRLIKRKLKPLSTECGGNADRTDENQSTP